MEIITVELGGGVEVQVEVAGSGPAILLLHAGVSERHMWDAQWDWLSEHHRVARWDWRGFGDTPHIPGPFSYADDVIRIMDALQLPSATLVGCSFGGAEAIHVAVTHPDRVERLALVGSGVPGFDAPNPPHVVELFQTGEEAWAREDIPAALEVEEQVWLIGPGRRAEDVDAAYLARARELLRRADQPDNGAVSLDMEWSAMDHLAHIAVPVLVVVGSEDVPSLIEASRHLAAVCPQARLEIIPDAAHLPSLEVPNAFNHILRDWLRATRG